ncbi:MAG: DUF421 domain-containing protein [Firmicutes bacterium]|jgi:uncharacterized membrane protein YcaP (DUF421 family)|nr:DUF421 domain-containing protein [Bacillota bacterium]
MPAWLAVVLRSAALYVVVFVFVRLLGKKHPAKLTPVYFVNYAVIAVIAGLLAAGVSRLLYGLLALAVWLLFPYLADHLSLRSKTVHDVLSGKETVLIKQGKIMEENLKTARMSAEELLKELRAKNVFSVADVEFAVLETSGEVSVLLKADKKPITPHDVEWQVAPQAEPQTVILDGNILHDSLTELGLTREWLETQLQQAGVTLDNVFLGQVNTAGELYLDLFDDALKPAMPTVQQSLYAMLEKAQADLYTFALETQNSQVRFMYEKNATRLQQVLDILRPHLLR